MRIAYLAAGAAGMYCGTCLHDNTLAAALLTAGEDVLLIPTYTPIRTDEPDVSHLPVRMGGINMYLQHKIPFFRHAPAFVDRWLDSPRLLAWLAKMQFSVQPEKLGPLTVATLDGEAGPLRKEVLKIAHWLAHDIKPEIVHLSNTMMVGLAREIRRQLNVPIVCSLAGEDVFLNRLPERYRLRSQEIARERAGDIDAFVAMNRYYADYMIDYLGVAPSRVHVIPHGLRLQGHRRRQRDPAETRRTIGYFARIHPDKGLHHLVDAFIQLARDPDVPQLRLKFAGYMAKADRNYLAEQIDKLQRAGLADRFEYAGELSRDEKIGFLQSVDVMSEPTVYQESKGLPVYEALANGVPVVVPAHGTFPELIAATGGGVLHEPENPADLARALKRLLADPAQLDEIGQRGFEALHTRYSDRVMAEKTVALYCRLLNPTRAGDAEAEMVSRERADA